LNVRPLLLGTLTALTVSVLIIGLTPPIDDFNPENPHWNGLSEFFGKFNCILWETPRSPNSKSTAFLIIGPSTTFTSSDIETIKGYLEDGGLLVVADDFGSANELLEALGVNVRINGSLLLDPLFKYRSSVLPKAKFGGGEVILNYASVVEGRGFQVLARSTKFSYLDLNGNMKFDKGEPSTSFPVAVRIKYGKGDLIVISDSSIFVNSMLKLGDNINFVKHILTGRKIVVDASHWTPSPFSRAKNILIRAFNILKIPEARYVLAILITAAFFRLRFKAKPYSGEASPIEETLNKHPNWNRHTLEMLEEDLRIGGKKGNR